jgi:hypothetical protein
MLTFYRVARRYPDSQGSPGPEVPQHGEAGECCARSRSPQCWAASAIASQAKANRQAGKGGRNRTPDRNPFSYGSFTLPVLPEGETLLHWADSGEQL